MGGVGSAERIRREWVVEWDEPDLEPPPGPATDPVLGEVVRRRIAGRDPRSVATDRQSADDSLAIDAWMLGEPSS